jgi:ribonuclease P protein component
MLCKKRNSLTRKNRISSYKEIIKIIKNGNKIREKNLIFYCKTNNINYDRIAILVGKENGNSVKRNKIKRIIREVFRKNQTENPPFYDILIKPVGENFLPSEIEECYLKWKESQKK